MSPDVSPSTLEVIRQRFELGAQWPTIDPFLFVAHHRDMYPAGNDELGPDASLTGRNIGMDFAELDGWNMYHGSTVPGFPQHPHRGFETITHVRRGLIDHADSLGATARFSSGDTQWMTAGAGIVHAEMFPLVEREAENPLELFQIWLNLPRADKFVDPYFTMLWSEDLPRFRSETTDGGTTEVTVIAGCLVPTGGRDLEPLEPPPNSWAARSEADVAIWHGRLTDDATFDLPPSRSASARRVIYAYDGSGLSLGTGAEIPPGTGAEIPPGTGAEIPPGTGAEIQSDQGVRLTATGGEAAWLLLQGRPIGEPVFQHGPFVMNDREGIIGTIDDYQRTGFGGWPWPSDGPVHPVGEGRFARHADGRLERR